MDLRFLGWTFYRFSRLRIVDKLNIVLRGLVLFSVIAVIIPVTLVMFYNIRQDALASAYRDSQESLIILKKINSGFFSQPKPSGRIPSSPLSWRIQKRKVFPLNPHHNFNLFCGKRKMTSSWFWIKTGIRSLILQALLLKWDNYPTSGWWIEPFKDSVRRRWKKTLFLPWRLSVPFRF